ncbi:MAG: hypothetical protein ACXAAO_16180 [Candidatus Thorarchaeota archaeon]|jgi:hypothetical protein
MSGEAWDQDVVLNLLREIIDIRPREIFGDSLNAVSKLISIVHENPQLDMKKKEEPIFLLQDFMNNRPFGLQMGMIVDKPVPRGLVMSSAKSLFPLEVMGEKKWGFRNPLFDLFLKERQYERDSKLIKAMNYLENSFEMRHSVASTAEQLIATMFFLVGSGGATGGKYDRTALIKIKFPRYLVVAPVLDKTIVFLSACVNSFNKTIERIIRMPDGWNPTVSLPIPSVDLIKNFVTILSQASKHVKSAKCGYPVSSNLPEFGGLFKHLVAIANSSNGPSTTEPNESMLFDNIDLPWERVENPPGHGGPAFVGAWEITGMDYPDPVTLGRYSLGKTKCTQCNMTMMLNSVKVSTDGLILCSHCGTNFEPIEPQD